MLSRSLLLPLAIVGAFGAPFVISSLTESDLQGTQERTDAHAAMFLSDPSPMPPLPTVAIPPLPPGETAPLIEGFQPVHDLREVIRFDVLPAWVRQRWQRVSTSPAENGLEGMRVALVTGTAPWDVRGSLTYYFDRNQRVQRIILRGYTGDHSRLASLVTSEFGLRSRPTSAAALFSKQNLARSTGVLALEYPAVIYREQHQSQFAIYLELTNPNGSVALTPEGHHILVSLSR